MRQGPLRDARVEDATGKRGPYASPFVGIDWFLTVANDAPQRMSNCRRSVWLRPASILRLAARRSSGRVRPRATRTTSDLIRSSNGHVSFRVWSPDLVCLSLQESLPSAELSGCQLSGELFQNSAHLVGFLLATLSAADRRPQPSV